MGPVHTNHYLFFIDIHFCPQLVDQWELQQKDGLWRKTNRRRRLYGDFRDPVRHNGEICDNERHTRNLTNHVQFESADAAMLWLKTRAIAILLSVTCIRTISEAFGLGKRVWEILKSQRVRNFSKRTLGGSCHLASALYVLSERIPGCCHPEFSAASFRHYVRKIVSFEGIASLISNVYQTDREAVSFSFSSISDSWASEKSVFEIKPN